MAKNGGSLPVFGGPGVLGGLGPLIGFGPGPKPPQETGFSGDFCGGKGFGGYTPTDPPGLSRKIVPFLSGLDMGRGTLGHHHFGHGAAARAPLVFSSLGGNLVFFIGHLWSHILDMFFIFV